MKLKTYITVIMALALLSGLSAEQKAEGEYGWKMLTIPANTSTLAMGGTGASISSEATSFIIHPTAGLLSNVKAISVTQQSWHFKTNINSVAINLPNGSSSYGVAIRTLDYGKFDARDIRGEIIGEFHPLDVNLIVNMARRITPSFYAGANLFILYEKIDSSSSAGIGSDLGLTYLTPIDGLDINLAMKHLGTTSKVKQENIKLPLTFETSVGYRLPQALQVVYAEVKAISHTDDDNLKLVMGANVDVTSYFNLRLGYRMNYDSHTYSAGFGLNLKNIGLDYAYLPFAYDTNDAHSFGLTYNF